MNPLSFSPIPANIIKSVKQRLALVYTILYRIAEIKYFINLFFFYQILFHLCYFPISFKILK